MDWNPVELVAVSGTMLILLVPVLGVTIRTTARPLIDALVSAGLIGPQRQALETGRLARRIVELEQEVDRLKRAQLPADLAPVDPQLHRIRS